jgi:hypothetical protein
MTGPTFFWWLSFSDPRRPEGQQFIGVLIMEGMTLPEVIMESHARGLNPGGECQFVKIPPEYVPPAQFHNRLLSYTELASAGLLE